MSADWRTTQAAGRTGTRVPDIVPALVLRQRVAALAGVPVDHVEPVEVVRYEPGGGYRLHHDGRHRVATLLAWLSDPEAYTGGGTDFPRAGGVHRGGMGDAILWHNTRQTIHQALPVETGIKWVAVSYVQRQAVDTTKRSGEV